MQIYSSFERIFRSVNLYCEIYFGAIMATLKVTGSDLKQYRGLLTAVPMVSMSVLPNCPCFYR